MTKRHLCEITTLQLYDVVEIIYEMGVEILPSRACHKSAPPLPQVRLLSQVFQVYFRPKC